MKKLFDDQKTAYLERLCRHPLLADVNKQALLSVLSIHHYPKNSLIYLQYDKVRYVYFLLDGAINCYRQQPNGQESLMASFDTRMDTSQQVLMINESLPTVKHRLSISSDHTPYSQYSLSAQQDSHQLTAKAAQSSFVALLPISELGKMIDLGGVFLWYGAQMHRQLSTQYLLYDLLSLKTAQAKVAYYLLAYADAKGVVTVMVNQKNLAGLLGLRAETLSRTLRILMSKKIIDTHAQGFVILDEKILAAIVEQ